MRPARRIALAGLGPHARRIYLPLLERHAARLGVRLVALVERADRLAETRAFLAGRALAPDALVGVEPDAAFAATLPLPVAATLAAAAPDALIVAGPPECHVAYATWALAAGVDVLVDKPLTCPPQLGRTAAAAQALRDDHAALVALQARSAARAVVAVQRRSHAGYARVRAIVDDVVRAHGLPPSFIDIAHADGMWVMPDEWDRDNHAYRHGSGKLMHSGYHFVDLLAWLLELGGAPAGDPALSLATFGPADVMARLGPETLQRLLGVAPSAEAFAPARLAALRSYGEQDVFAQLQWRDGDAVRTTARLALQQHSLSQRAWSTSAADTYKGNGRIRHERVEVHVAPLLSVQVHSYQAHQIGEDEGLPYGPGHLDHFDVHVFRNRRLLGGPAYERLELGRTAADAGAPAGFGHNERAREARLLAFLAGDPALDDIRDQGPTIALLARLYAEIAAQRRPTP